MRKIFTGVKIHSSIHSQEVFHNPDSVFMRVKVMDLLFDGVDVDCSSQEFAAKAVCTAFEDAAQLRTEDGGSTYKFSFFHAVSRPHFPSHTCCPVICNLRKTAPSPRHTKFYAA